MIATSIQCNKKTFKQPINDILRLPLYDMISTNHMHMKINAHYVCCVFASKFLFQECQQGTENANANELPFNLTSSVWRQSKHHANMFIQFECYAV